MAEEQNAWMEKLEMQNEELREQMGKMMEMMSQLIKGKAEMSTAKTHNNPERESANITEQSFERQDVHLPLSTSAKAGSSTQKVAAVHSNPLFFPDPTQVDMDEKEKQDEKEKKLLDLINERFKMLDGSSYHKTMNAEEISLVPGLVIP